MSSQFIIQNSESTLKTYQTFHPLTRLPAEIRIKIWIQAASFSQVITLQPTDDESRQNYDYNSGACLRCPLMQVNKGARVEALKLKSNIYDLERGPNITIPQYEGMGSLEYRRLLGPIVHVNLDVDTLWLQRRRELERFAHPGCCVSRYAEVRKLAFSCSLWILEREDGWLECPELHVMDMKPEELYLVVDHEERMEAGTAEIVDVDDLYACFPRESTGTDEKRPSYKSWEELLALEV